MAKLSTKEIIDAISEMTILEVKDLAYKYSKIPNCTQELNKVKAYWYELLNRVEVKTPLESFNIMINTWAKYQTIVSRLWAKSGYYQSGGAIGFRDQLQDSISTKFLNAEMVKKQILQHAKHQFIEGDTEHWWHDETKRGIRTRFSDDRLWLVYLTLEYIKFTGDYSILDIEIPYVEGNILNENEDEAFSQNLLNRFPFYANEVITQVCSAIKPKYTFACFEIKKEQVGIPQTMPSDFVSFGDDVCYQVVLNYNVADNIELHDDDFIYHVAIKVNFSCTYTFFFVPLHAKLLKRK